MTNPIPEGWRKNVVTILREAPDYSRIIYTQRAITDFEAQFPDSFPPSDLCRMLADALEDPIEGKEVFMGVPGVTWAFIFMHKNQPVYGKICLQKGKDSIMIFSAHRPLKGTTL